MGTFLLYAQGQQIGHLPLNGTRLQKDTAKTLLSLHVKWISPLGAGLHRVSRSGQGRRWRGILEGFWAAIFGSLTHRRGGGSLWLGVTSD